MKRLFVPGSGPAFLFFVVTLCPLWAEPPGKGGVKKKATSNEAEKKVVDDEIEEHFIVRTESFYIADMIAGAYDALTAKDDLSAKTILNKIAGFVLSEQGLTRRPDAAAALKENYENLRTLSKRLQKLQPVKKADLDVVFAGTEKALHLAYGSKNNAAMKKEIESVEVMDTVIRVNSFTLKDVFVRTMEAFNDGESKEAALRLERAVPFIKKEMDLAITPEGKAALTVAHTRLAQLHQGLVNDKIDSEDDLKTTFSMTHKALAVAYQKRTNFASFNKRITRLKLATQHHLKSAKFWSR